MEVEPPGDLLRDRVAVLPGGSELDAAGDEWLHGSEGVQERPEQLAVLHAAPQHDEQLHTDIHSISAGTRHLRNPLPVNIG